jgi:hypothetical protein
VLHGGDEAMPDVASTMHWNDGEPGVGFDQLRI